MRATTAKMRAGGAKKPARALLVGFLACLGVIWAQTRVPEVSATGVGDCAELEITEVYTNFREDKSEQFVEFFNPTAEVLSLEGCVLRTKYGGKLSQAEFGEVLLWADEYRAYSLQSLGLQLAKSPTVERVVEFWSAATPDASMALSVDLADLPKSAAGKSWALVGDEWVNATPTPSADNKTAPEFAASGVVGSGSGLSGGAGAAVSPEALAPIEYESSAVSSGSVGSGGSSVKEYADCGEGKYRNPETNRCKKIEAETGAKPCAEGYERNPETNRCRKVRENTGAAAGFGVPDSGGTESGEDGGTGASAVGSVLANVTGTLGAAFRGENGKLRGWKVALAAIGAVLITGAAVCWVFRGKLRKLPVFTGVFKAIRGVYERVYGKIVAIMGKIAEKY